MVIIELICGVPAVTGGPVSSFDRYKVSEHLEVDPDDVCVVSYQGAPVWCKSTEAGTISAWYPGKEVDIKRDGVEHTIDVSERIEKFLIDKEITVPALCISVISHVIAEDRFKFINVLTQNTGD